MLNHMPVCEELFHTASGLAFADFITDGHSESWPIRSERFVLGFDAAIAGRRAARRGGGINQIDAGPA
jgi:hypothetical protein